jgi:hypothetical protein
MQRYLERNIENLRTFLYEPFHSLSMGNLCEIMKSARILDSVDEYLEKDKSVVEVDAFSSP